MPAKRHAHVWIATEGGGRLAYGWGLCGQAVYSREHRNTDPEQVTCARCRRSRAWAHYLEQGA